MTSKGRLNRSFFCSTVAVIASTVAVVILGFLANKGNFSSFITHNVAIDILGMPLAPGWLLIRGAFERLRPNEFFGAAFLIPLISVPIDAGVIFAVWELLHGRERAHTSDSD
jgi:hypothetical protein